MPNILRKRVHLPETKFKYYPSMMRNGFYNLYFCGHLFLGPNHYVYRNNYDLLNVVYCKQGEMQINIDGVDYFLSAGKTACLCLDNKITFKTANDPVTEIYSVYFQGISLLNLFENHLNKGFKFISNSLNDELIKIVGKYLINDSHNIYESSVESYNFLLKLYKLLEKDSKEIKASIEYVKLHYYQKNLTLEKIAKHCGYSKYHFARIFKQETGKTVIEFLNEIRVQNALQFLRDKSIKIENVSKLVGYQDQRSLVLQFKKIYGTTPKKYRLKLLEEDYSN